MYLYIYISETAKTLISPASSRFAGVSHLRRTDVSSDRSSAACVGLGFRAGGPQWAPGGRTHQVTLWGPLFYGLHLIIINSNCNIIIIKIIQCNIIENKIIIIIIQFNNIERI